MEGEEGPFISVPPQGWGAERDRSVLCNRASPTSAIPRVARAPERSNGR